MSRQSRVNLRSVPCDDGAYAMGMDLFMALCFFWMVIMLINTGAIPVAGHMPKSGFGSEEHKTLTLYIANDGRSIRVGKPSATPLTGAGAEQAVVKVFAAQLPRRVVLAAPARLPVDALERWLDEFTALAQKQQVPPQIGLAVVGSKE